MHLRPATIGDASAIATIYNDAVATPSTFDLRPRSLSEQEEWIRDRVGAHAALVADDDGMVVGFGSLSPYRDRPAYATTVEDSVYVDGQRRGENIGGRLLAGLVDVATTHGFHCVMARIVAGNDASVALHESAQFELVGTEREVGRKFGRWLDVVVYQRLLMGPPARDGD